MSETRIMLGAADHGRSMPLAEFLHAEGQPGKLYELSRGVVTVIDVPGRPHLKQVKEIKRQLHGYDFLHPGVIDTIASGNECKIVVPPLESERHPDLTIYLTPMPDAKDLWGTWIPDIVIEVVSPGSRHRDYVEKRDEYLMIGVTEYWIVDHSKREMLVLERSVTEDQWVEKPVQPPAIHQSRLLPGLDFSCQRVFEAAD